MLCGCISAVFLLPEHPLKTTVIQHIPARTHVLFSLFTFPSSYGSDIREQQTFIFIFIQRFLCYCSVSDAGIFLYPLFFLIFYQAGKPLISHVKFILINQHGNIFVIQSIYRLSSVSCPIYPADISIFPPGLTLSTMQLPVLLYFYPELPDRKSGQKDWR